MVQLDDTSLVCRAYKEQMKLQLPWYCNLNRLQTTINRDNNSYFDSMKADEIACELKNIFEKMWSKEIHSQPKLQFYNTIKTSFEYEPYLNKSTDKRRSVSRFRSSSHRLNVELARYAQTTNNKKYGSQQKHMLDKRCHICTDDNKNIELLVELPFMNIIIEYELHVLRTCPIYEHLRAKLPDNIKSMLFNDDYIHGIFYLNHAKETTDYINNIMKLRFPTKI